MCQHVSLAKFSRSCLFFFFIYRATIGPSIAGIFNENLGFQWSTSVSFLLRYYLLARLSTKPSRCDMLLTYRGSIPVRNTRKAVNINVNWPMNEYLFWLRLMHKMLQHFPVISRYPIPSEFPMGLTSRQSKSGRAP